MALKRKRKGNMKEQTLAEFYSGGFVGFDIYLLFSQKIKNREKKE